MTTKYIALNKQTTINMHNRKKREREREGDIDDNVNDN